MSDTNGHNGHKYQCDYLHCNTKNKLGNIAFRWEQLNLLFTRYCMSWCSGLLGFNEKPIQLKKNTTFPTFSELTVYVIAQLWGEYECHKKSVYLWSWLNTLYSTYWNYQLTSLLLKIITKLLETYKKKITPENDPNHQSSHFYENSPHSCINILIIVNCLCFNELSMYCIIHTNVIICKENSRKNRKCKGPRVFFYIYMCTYRNTENDKEVKGLVFIKSNSDLSCIFQIISDLK